MTARILEVTQAEYYADPCERPSLTQSMATTLLRQSPAHAWLRHPRLGGMRSEPTPAMQRGTLIHSLLLGQAADIVVVDAADWRTKEAKAQREAAESAGKIAVLADAYAEISDAATVLSAKITDLGIELTGDSEVAIEWTEPTAAGDVLCRGMLDHLHHDGTIIDLKTARSAHPKACAKHVVEYGYDIQRAAYASALSKLRPELTGAIDFVFVFMETEPPFSVTPARLDGMLRELGERRWQRACELWQRCLSTDTWPTYTDQITTLECPPWALSEEIEANEHE